MTSPWLVALGLLVVFLGLALLCMWLGRPVRARAGRQRINAPPPPPPPQRTRAVHPAVVVQWLAPRRACLAGARDTLAMVAGTLENAESIEAASLYLVGPVHERLLLLDLALRQFDDALAGREPEPSP